MSEKKKIKVLRIINRFNIGGPTYNATFLTRFLSDDFETLLIGGLPEADEKDSLHILKEYDVEPILIEEMKRKPNFQSDRKAYLKIKEIIKEYKPDIVHTHAAKAGALGRRAAFELNVPVVVHTYHGHVFHSYFGRFKTILYKYIEKRLAKKTTGIIAISDLQKNELTVDHKICNKRKIKVIPLGFDLRKFQVNSVENRKKTRSKYKLKEDDIAIAIVGRLAPIKNHGYFLDVIENVALKTTKNLVVFIVGDGSEKINIQERIKLIDDRINLRFEMTSWIKEIDVFNAGMDIICLTSKNEGTPVSLIEAQASNIPVISTDVGGVKDIVAEGKTGFVVSQKNKHEFIEKLLILIEDEKKREFMSQNGWSFVETKFHYTTLVRNMEDYYKKLLKGTN